MPVTRDTQNFYRDYLNGTTKPVLTGAGPYDFSNSKPAQFTNDILEQEQKKYFDKNKAFNPKNIKGFNASYLFEDSNPVVQAKKSREQNQPAPEWKGNAHKMQQPKVSSEAVKNAHMQQQIGFGQQEQNQPAQNQPAQNQPAQNQPVAIQPENNNKSVSTQAINNTISEGNEVINPFTGEKTRVKRTDISASSDNNPHLGPTDPNKQAEKKNSFGEIFNEGFSKALNNVSEAGEGSLAAGLGAYFNAINSSMSPDAINFRNKENITNEQAIQKQKDEQRARQIANRDYRGEAEQDAMANAAVQNAQNVQNLGNASAGAAALSRRVGTADYATAKQRSDVQQQHAEGLANELYDIRRAAANYGFKSAAQRKIDAEATEDNMYRNALSSGLGKEQNANAAGTSDNNQPAAVTSDSNQPAVGTSDSNQPTAGVPENKQPAKETILGNYGFNDSSGKTYTVRDAATRLRNIEGANKLITKIQNDYPATSKHLLDMDSEIFKKVDYLFKRDDLSPEDNNELLNILSKSNLSAIDYYDNDKNLYAGGYRVLQMNTEFNRIVTKIINDIDSIYNKYRLKDTNSMSGRGLSAYFDALNSNKPKLNVPFKG